jgi:hypothetical protein
MKDNFQIFSDLVTRELSAKLAVLGFFPWEPEGRSEARINCFRRKRPPETHLLDLRFDKYQRYRCGIGVGKIVGPTARTLFRQERSADEINLSALPDRCVLNGNSLLGRGHFVAPLYCRLRGPIPAARWVIGKIAGQLGIVEKWFESGEIGPGLSCFSLGQREPGGLPAATLE